MKALPYMCFINIVLVHLATITNYHRLGGLNYKHFLQFWGLNSEIRVPAGSGSGKNPFLGCTLTTSQCILAAAAVKSLTWWEKATWLSALFLRQSHSGGFYPHDLIIPKGPH